VAEDLKGSVNKDFITEDHAALDLPNYEVGTSSNTLRRTFGGVPVVDVRLTIEFLREYGSIDNSKPSGTVENPKAGQIEWTGTWANSLVMWDEETKDIVQVLTKTTGAITGIADLAAMEYIETQNNEILDLFNFVTGEGDDLTLAFFNIENSDANQAQMMTTLTDAALVAEFAAGWTYADRHWVESKDKNTADFIVRFRKVAWNAWGHDFYAEDFKSYPRAGASNETEGIRKTWEDIQIADLATAVSNCRTGTNVPAENDYVITDVLVNNSRNGAFSITQVQRKQIDGVDESGSIQLNPHSFETGTAAVVTTVYEGWFSTDLPDGTAITEGSDILSNIPFIMGNGLWGREVKSLTPSWSDRIWADNKKQMAQVSAGGFGLGETNRVTGLSDTTYAAAVTAAKAASDADIRLVTSVSLAQRKNGERVVSQNERIVYIGVTDDDAVITRIKAGQGSPRALVRVWPRRTSAARTTLTTEEDSTRGKAISNYSYNDGSGTAVLYTHAVAEIQDHGDGAYTVRQFLTDLSDTTTWYWEETYTVRTEKLRTYRDGTETKTESMYITFTKRIKMHSSESAAWQSIQDLSTASPTPHKIIRGTDRVKKLSRFVYQSTVIYDPLYYAWTPVTVTT